MPINTDFLRRELDAVGTSPDDTAVKRMSIYADLLVEWNQKMNLTAITEPDAIVTRHFADSATFFSAVDPAINSSLIDVGSGAGFPGLPVKILRPDMNVTLLDSTNKRVTFLQTVINELGLDGVTAVHARAEEGANSSELREQFDFATARAVAQMRLLSEYCLGFLKPNGIFVALKGQLTDDEISAAANAIKVMGGKYIEKSTLSLSDGSERTLVTVKKISHTPSNYPRCSAKIAKKPL